MIIKLFAIFCVLTVTQIVMAESKTSIHDIALKDINGQPTSLKSFKGKVVLLVNVASKCGLTPQYEALEGLQKKYGTQGFTVVGLPCNDFGGQEPGSNQDIKQFCSTKYKVTFPLMDKVKVLGSERHPLYVRLTGKDAEFPGDIKWNFGKFLIAKDGTVLKRFEPQTKPDSDDVSKAVEAALAQK